MKDNQEELFSQLQPLKPSLSPVPNFISKPLADEYYKDLIAACIDMNKPEIKPYVHYEQEYPKAYVSIDPGKSGGIVAMCNEQLVGKWIIPIVGEDIDIKALYSIISDLIKQYKVTLILEDVHSIFGTSASSNFSFGFVCGVIEAIVVLQDVRLIKVQPKAWQKVVWINSDMQYKPKKPDQKKPSVDTKATSLMAARRLFPTDDFRKSDRAKIAHDGLIDAGLMCEYARRSNL